MKNILVIEDDERVSDVIRAYLEREGYNVQITAKGMEGIEIERKSEIDLIILDLMLPDISGEEVCRYAKR